MVKGNSGNCFDTIKVKLSFSLNTHFNSNEIFSMFFKTVTANYAAHKQQTSVNFFVCFRFFFFHKNDDLFSGVLTD